MWIMGRYMSSLRRRTQQQKLSATDYRSGMEQKGLPKGQSYLHRSTQILTFIGYLINS